MFDNLPGAVQLGIAGPFIAMFGVILRTYLKEVEDRVKKAEAREAAATLEIKRLNGVMVEDTIRALHASSGAVDESERLVRELLVILDRMKHA